MATERAVTGNGAMGGRAATRARGNEAHEYEACGNGHGAMGRAVMARAATGHAATRRMRLDILLKP